MSLSSSANVNNRLAVIKPRNPTNGTILAARFRVHLPVPLNVQSTLPFGELARVSAMAQYGRLNEGALSEVLSGRADTGRLRGHGHAFYLPTDEDGDGVLDHLTIYASGGLGPKERAALSNLKSISWAAGDGGFAAGARVDLYVEGFIQAADMDTYPHLFGPAKVWRSRTPFVLSRYPKQYRDGRPKLNDDGRQIDGPEDQLLREWDRRRGENHELPAIVRVKRIDRLELPDGRAIRWTDFCRRRTRGAGRSSDFAFGFEIEFESPLRRHPVALGYGCHYGLGQFTAINL